MPRRVRGCCAVAAVQMLNNINDLKRIRFELHCCSTAPLVCQPGPHVSKWSFAKFEPQLRLRIPSLRQLWRTAAACPCRLPVLHDWQDHLSCARADRRPGVPHTALWPQSRFIPWSKSHLHDLQWPVKEAQAAFWRQPGDALHQTPPVAGQLRPPFTFRHFPTCLKAKRENRSQSKRSKICMFHNCHSIYHNSHCVKW